MRKKREGLFFIVLVIVLVIANGCDLGVKITDPIEIIDPEDGIKLKWIGCKDYSDLDDYLWYIGDAPEGVFGDWEVFKNCTEITLFHSDGSRPNQAQRTGNDFDTRTYNGGFHRS